MPVVLTGAAPYILCCLLHLRCFPLCLPAGLSAAATDEGDQDRDAEKSFHVAPLWVWVRFVRFDLRSLPASL
jgi:hypothetical protein